MRPVGSTSGLPSVGAPDGPGRTKRRSNYLMQSIAGLHVGSLIDRNLFDVRLHNEDWHGPYDTSKAERYDLVFLTGLQPDFEEP